MVVCSAFRQATDILHFTAQSHGGGQSVITRIIIRTSRRVYLFASSSPRFPLYTSWWNCFRSKQIHQGANQSIVIGTMSSPCRTPLSVSPPSLSPPSLSQSLSSPRLPHTRPSPGSPSCSNRSQTSTFADLKRWQPADLSSSRVE